MQAMAINKQAIAHRQAWVARESGCVIGVLLKSSSAASGTPVREILVPVGLAQG
jgi:hypothetical protein